MGAIRSLAQRALNRVAKRVAQDNLFEKPGERRKADPLPDATPPKPPEAPPAAPPVLCEAVAPEALAALLGPAARARVLHHWATWCAPCDEELPRVEALARALGARAEVVGVGWELFEDPSSPDAAAQAVSEYAYERGLSWKTLLVTEDPDSFFKRFNLSFKKIPQTAVVGADGSVLLRIDGAMSEEDVRRIQALVGP